MDKEIERLKELLRYIQGMTCETTTCPRCAYINEIIESKLGRMDK